MAKIDTSKITGYAEMTAEQKLAALEAFDVPAPDMSGYVSKAQFDKTSSECADWKRKHNALLSEDERKKAESDEALKSMQSELESLRREKVLSERTASFIALGYGEDLAAKTAKAMVDGDMATVFANQKAFMEAHDKSMRAEAMKNTPTPPAGSIPGGQDYQKLIDDAMSRGDYASAAAYTRQSQEKASKTD